MELREYFKGTKGRGILATSDKNGKVDMAVYAKPHFFDDGMIAFIMANRLSHHNLQTNKHAAYLFMEEGGGYRGRRLFLTRVREEQDTELLYSLRTRKYPVKKEEGKPRFLVFFKIDKVLPLIGAGEESSEQE
ncbi:MAG TPA: pyridoxamine 5'-phosphate oxidase family protein [Deltaproteobacteria bacterium]|nr:pyridoxamine 5'-phosphate oxidase family protein [Deltaproteobacteria bacterium]HIJ36681.1 pyridoxamine 5'-phosphate oxidase family protein [Deltaproteobacteria bacterium]HIJ41989.1 pyridoxamine 5'-phosphate oxidase family protein [Deltaproteobacteria bacterium]